MKTIKDVRKKSIRLTSERNKHIESEHPEMKGQIDKIIETLQTPDIIIQSKTDSDAELFYKWYNQTPVTSKYLCVIVKFVNYDSFILTVYFTDTIKKGKELWTKQ